MILAVEKSRILQEVADHFISTIPAGHFNGVNADTLKKIVDIETLKLILVELVNEGAINCTFSRYDGNIYIKRLPSLPSDRQIVLIAESELSEIGCYPTEREIRSRFDLESLNDRPFSKMLAAGEAQIDFTSFDFAVLERYINDPRFGFSFEDYSGDFSIKSEYYNKGTVVREGRLDPW